MHDVHPAQLDSSPSVIRNAAGDVLVGRRAIAARCDAEPQPQKASTPLAPPAQVQFADTLADCQCRIRCSASKEPPLTPMNAYDPQCAPRSVNVEPRDSSAVRKARLVPLARSDCPRVAKSSTSPS
eukprot:7384445-Prymnesium_polylepis.1